MRIDARDLLSRTEVRKLLSEIKASAKLAGCSASYLTHRLVKNGHMPTRLAAGGSILKSTAIKLRRLMAAAQ